MLSFASERTHESRSLPVATEPSGRSTRPLAASCRRAPWSGRQVSSRGRRTARTTTNICHVCASVFRARARTYTLAAAGPRELMTSSEPPPLRLRSPSASYCFPASFMRTKLRVPGGRAPRPSSRPPRSGRPIRRRLLSERAPRLRPSIWPCNLSVAPRPVAALAADARDGVVAPQRAADKNGALSTKPLAGRNSQVNPFRPPEELARVVRSTKTLPLFKAGRTHWASCASLCALSGALTRARRRRQTQRPVCRRSHSLASLSELRWCAPV